jgi:hypothetical protein
MGFFCLIEFYELPSAVDGVMCSLLLIIYDQQIIKKFKSGGRINRYNLKIVTVEWIIKKLGL